MLRLHEVSLSFGDRRVLENCSLSLSAGDRIALMGPSGCGKTSLLRVALGLQRPDAGEVFLRARRAAAVFQEPRLLPWLSAVENVNLVLSDGKATLGEAGLWLDRLGLGDSGRLLPSELSGGMQQRVSLARALACGPDLLLLDEPFRGMDEALRGRVLRLISDSLNGAALLLISHDREEAEALGCRVLRYASGRFEP